MSDADTDSEIPGIPIPTEEDVSLAILILILLLAITMGVSYFFQRRKIRVLHETIVGLLLGVFIGMIIRLSPGDVIQRTVTFDSKVFFNMLLPPIIFNSGYDLSLKRFRKQFPSILLFAVAGTLISACVIGVLLRIVLLTGMHGLNWSLLECTSFGSILSSTDPVTILAIFSQLKVEPQLYTVIFGETMLNDATAIVLHSVLERYKGTDFSTSTLFGAMGKFIGVSAGSCAIGISVALACALMLKYSDLYRFPHLETSLVLLFAYCTYLLSNAAGLSGIVSLLLCAIVLKQYAYESMSLRSKRTTRYMLEVMAHLSENVIFAYLGLTIFTQTEGTFHFGLVFFTFIFSLVGRAAAIFPLAYLSNWILRQNKTSPNYLPRSYQIMLFWAGLRGAVAFALAFKETGTKASSILTTTLVIVALSVLMFGGTTTRALDYLGVRIGVSEDSENDEQVGPMGRFGRFEQKYISPLFCRPKRGVMGRPWEEEAEDDNDDFGGNLVDDRSFVEKRSRASTMPGRALASTNHLGSRSDLRVQLGSVSQPHLASLGSAPPLSMHGLDVLAETPVEEDIEK